MVKSKGGAGKQVAGPLADDGFIRGLPVFEAATLEEARRWGRRIRR